MEEGSFDAEGNWYRSVRILIVNCAFPRDPAVESGGGGTVVAYELAKKLVAKGHQIAVFTSHNLASIAPYAVEEYALSGIAVTTVNVPEGSDPLSDENFYNPRINEAFARVVSAHSPDVVHFHSLQGIGLSVIPVAKALGAATIVTSHDWWWLCPYHFLCRPTGSICADSEGLVTLESCDCAGSQCLRRRREVAATVAPHVDLFLTPSEYARSSLIGLGLATPERIAVNPNGIDLDQREASTGTHEPLTFGYLGGLNTVKGYKVLLDAFTSLDLEHTRQARLVMYGMLPARATGDGLSASIWSSGETGLVGKFRAKAKADPALALRVTCNYILRRAHLLASTRMAKYRPAGSRVDNIDLRPPFGIIERDDVFSELDVVVVPSLVRETFSLVAREALLRGTPVVATRCGGLEEVVKDRVNGILVNAGSVVELKSAIEELIKSQSLVRQLREGASATSIPSLDEQISQLEKHYDTLCKASLQQPLAAAVPAAQPSFGRTRHIAGQRHTHVSREDGFGFYLNDFFLYCLLDRPNTCAQRVAEIMYGSESVSYSNAQEILTSLRLINERPC